jgi:DNA-binding NarL/FixJ family response regulator
MTSTRILLADDHALILDALTKVLADDWTVVGQVSDGNLLAAAVDKLRPEILVLDIAMPPVNGLNLAGRSKDSPAVKLIFLTMNEDPDVAAEAFRAGASAHALGDRRPRAVDRDSGGHARRQLHHAFVTRGVVKALLAEDQKIPHGLTPRQRDVLPLIVRGH